MHIIYLLITLKFIVCKVVDVIVNLVLKINPRSSFIVLAYFLYLQALIIFRAPNTPHIAVIREVYDSENAYEVFELELERALDIGYYMIVIEPTRLGDETGRWISVGNCLHKTAVLSGLGVIGFGMHLFILLYTYIIFF